MNLKRGLFSWWMIAAVLLLTACGFHLRGSVVLPVAMQSTYVDGDQFSLLVRELGVLLQTSGAQVVKSQEQATAVLKVLKESDSRRVLSVSAAGKPAEYEVSHSVEYTLLDAEGKVVVPRQVLSARRDYQFDETDVLGKSEEEERLREEMQRDLALRIMQRLSILAR